MKKRCVYILSIFALLFLSACSAGKDHKEKLRDVEFTVVGQNEAPEELTEIIREEREKAFMLTYADKGWLYLARGYGERETSGYSVEVKECYETEDVIAIKTELIGPQADEEIAEESTYPYIVVKIEYSDKHVIFE